MTRTRQAFPAANGFTGPITLSDLDELEADVASIPGMIFWPWIDATYGYVPGSSPRRVWNRVAEEDEIGNVSQSSPTNITVTRLAQGTPAINMGSVNTFLRYTASDFSEGFTIGCVVNGTCAISSNTSNSSCYHVRGKSDENSGKLKVRVLDAVLDYADYSGPVLAPGIDRLVILTCDVPGKRATLYVDGAEAGSLGFTNTATPHPQFQYGIVNDQGTVTSIYGLHGLLLAGTRAFSADEITKIAALAAAMKAA